MNKKFTPYLFNPVMVSPTALTTYHTLEDAVERAKRELAKVVPGCWVKIVNQNYDIVWDSRKQRAAVAKAEGGE